MQETKALISAMTGESRGGSRAAAPGCGFSRGATARSVSLSRGAREVVNKNRLLTILAKGEIFLIGINLNKSLKLGH